jgi:hypothetical protein
MMSRIHQQRSAMTAVWMRGQHHTPPFTVTDPVCSRGSWYTGGTDFQVLIRKHFDCIPLGAANQHKPIGAKTSRQRTMPNSTAQRHTRDANQPPKHHSWPAGLGCVSAASAAHDRQSTAIGSGVKSLAECRRKADVKNAKEPGNASQNL